MDPGTEALPIDSQPLTSMSSRHVRRSTDPGARTSSIRLSRLSEVHDDPDDIEPPEPVIAQQHGNVSNNTEVRANRNRISTIRPDRFEGQSPSLQPNAGTEQDGASLGQGTLPPPSYRTAPSVYGNSGRSRRSR